MEVSVIRVLLAILTAFIYEGRKQSAKAVKPIQTGKQVQQLHSITLDSLQKGTKLRIVVTSDTHCEQNDMLNIPEGDITKFLPKSDNVSQDPQLASFMQWLEALPHKHKVICCGNHEVGLGKLSKDEIAKLFPPRCYYLQDSGISIEGINLYGSPWTSNSMYGLSYQFERETFKVESDSKERH